MSAIVEIELELKAVKFALASFQKYRNKEEARVAYLDSQVESVQFLEIFSDFPKDKLVEAMLKLQDALTVLRMREERLQNEKREQLLLAQQQGGIFIYECLDLE